MLQWLEQIEVAVKKVLPWVIYFNSWFLLLGILGRQGNKLWDVRKVSRRQDDRYYTHLQDCHWVFLSTSKLWKIFRRRVLCIFFLDWMEILPLVNIERKLEITELHVNYLCIQFAAVNGGTRILNAVNYCGFYFTDYGRSCRPWDLAVTWVPCSLRALLEGRRECAKHSLLGSQLTSGGFIMLAEKSDVFPSSPEGLTALFILLLVCPEQKK